ncbi:MAG: peroxiredoxin [Bacteroidales bacterium]|jgi:peroxiredoxin (alkyl hydroperoxide reductase subunit C)|nr:peroxiredoxin [Bacteroidales bacterium]
MKLTVFLTCTILLTFSLHAQENETYRIPLIGEKAPSFTGQSTEGTIHFPDDYFGHWKILFSHPADFTPVCSTEILELAEIQDDFSKLDTKLVVMSTDGLNSHIEWVRSLHGIKRYDRESITIEFPLVSDPDLEISKKYGMLHPTYSTTRDVRGVFIIDPEDKICATFFYPASTGRNMEEIKRVLIALQTSAKRNVLTPANWQPGDDVLIDSPESIEAAEKLAAKNNPDLYSLEWYLWFKKSK